MIGEEALAHHCRRFAEGVEEDLRAGYVTLDEPMFMVAERRLNGLFCRSTFDAAEFVKVPDDTDRD